MSYSVGRRTRELGTRLALGASRRDIVGLVLRQAAAIAAVGLAVGVGRRSGRGARAVIVALRRRAVGSAGARRRGRGAVVTALGASYLPARRASRVDPAATLTAE